MFFTWLSNLPGTPRRGILRCSVDLDATVWKHKYFFQPFWYTAAYTPTPLRGKTNFFQPFWYAAEYTPTPLHSNTLSRCKPLRRCLANKILNFFLKTPSAFHFSPTQIFSFLSALSLVFFACRNPNPRSTPMAPRKSIPVKRQRASSTLRATPPPWRIPTGSFLGRPSESTMSYCSTAHLSRNEVFQPLKRSSTSSSRTAAGRHSVHPLSSKWLLLCGNSTPIFHSRVAPPFLFEASGSSLVPKKSTRFTAFWMTTTRTIEPYLRTHTMNA